MGSIHKLPVFFSLIFAIITVLASLANGKSFEKIAVEASIAIIVSYILGLIVRNSLISMAKEILKTRYSIEEKKQANKKVQNTHENAIVSSQSSKN